MMKRFSAVVLAVLLVVSGFALAENAHQKAVVLFTNDVHCAIDENIGYAGLAAYEEAYERLGCDVLIADCGDAIQGAPVGTLSKGGYIIDIMNEVGYDVATIGNHEFDYGMDALYAAMERADFPYVAANFCDNQGNPLLKPYVIQEVGGWKLGFVGVVAPDTYSKTNPANFQDADGNYIYHFSQGKNGETMYAAVQAAVDAAIADGAEIIVVLSHLGTEEVCSPYTSVELIMNTTGIDVLLDGHSHSVTEQEIVLNEAGEEVILASTGIHFANVGALTIEMDTEGTALLSTKLHSETLFQDAETAAFVASIKKMYEEDLNEVIATSEVDLVIADPTAVDESGKPIRIVRSQETNLGDLCADAYRSLLDSDIAFVNGAGVRAAIPAGNITYGQILNVHPFGNMACMIEIEGRHILDALEMGACAAPLENNGFLQCSGINYEINTAIESSLVLDDEGNFVEVAGERRVSNVLVNGEVLDPDKIYTVASHNFMLKDGGDGFVMFKNGRVVVDEVMIDNQVLINYIIEELGGVVAENYADPYGQGRIVIK